MANKSINTLDNASSLANNDLLVLWQSSTNTACNMTGQQFAGWLTALADGHGGISEITWTTSGTSGDGQYHNATIHYADGLTDTFSIRDGVKGNTGAQTYVWIRYSENEPTADADMGTIPSPWMGIYVGTTSTAPSTYTSYTWYKIKGDKGDTGESISQIRMTGQSGLVDTYTVTTDAGTNVGTFTVTNGNGGVSTVNEVAPDGDGNVQLFITSVADLGLTVGSAVIDDAYDALIAGQVLMCPATDFANGQLPNNNGAQTNGTVEIVKTDSTTNGWIEFHGKTGGVGDYRMYLDSSGNPTGTWVSSVSSAIPLAIRTQNTMAFTNLAAGQSQFALSAFSNFSDIASKAIQVIPQIAICSVQLTGTQVMWDNYASQNLIIVNNPVQQDVYINMTVIYKP